MSDYNPAEIQDQDDLEEHPAPRNKRRKYTAVACDECRRRKLKCIPSQNEGCCQRCASKGLFACGYKPLRRGIANSQGEPADDVVSALSQNVKMLRDTMRDWTTVVRELTVNGNEKILQAPPAPPPAAPDTFPSRNTRTFALGQDSPGAEASESTPAVNTSSARWANSSLLPRNVPEEPRFIGLTRSAYSIKAGEQALSRMGIPGVELPPPSGQQSPTGSPKEANKNLDEDFWQHCDYSEFTRLIIVFQEEVESVYPCVDTDYLIDKGPEVIRLGQQSEEAAREIISKGDSCIDLKDLQLAKVAIATAVVIEGHGKSDNSTTMVSSVEGDVMSILLPRRELKDLQLLVMLSIYYFHVHEDLLAWRTIGLAAREALVLGLHRKATLLETFPTKEHRELAVRVFWTIYVLDRRWSFGTSLPFALVDRDIDHELPEPGEDFAYLQCMVGYGRLCSIMWDALMPFGLRPDENPEEITTELDIKTQEWFESIPAQLRLCHPRLGLATRAQPPVLHRLRALLYLRGNYFRILIYRYYLLGPNRIKKFNRNAWLAVDIAQDSIEVLVHLNESSDIYRRQQAAFNYFLISALAVLFLAICNDPETFAAPCKKSLHSAIELLRHFSRHSQGSRRLWSSVRGIIPRLRRLELRRAERAANAEEGSPQDQVDKTTERASVTITASQQSSGSRLTTDTSSHGDTASESTLGKLGTHIFTGPPGICGTGGWNGNSQMIPSLTPPDIIDMTNELIGLFETFEQGPHPFLQADGTVLWDDSMYAPNFLSEDQGEISWQFNGLIQ